MSKNYDVDKVKYLYEKYGSLQGVSMRTGYAPGTVKKILQEQGIELKKYVPPRWNIKETYKEKN